MLNEINQLNQLTPTPEVYCNYVAVYLVKVYRVNLLDYKTVNSNNKSIQYNSITIERTSESNYINNPKQSYAYVY